MYKFEKPIEMPRGSHYGSNYWIMYSRKLNRNVKAYSNLEHENHLTLEMDPEVEYYCEQPLRTEVYIDSKKHTTVFDVWVLYKDGREEFQEVKYTSDLDKSQSQIAVQKAWCDQSGFSYTVRTEQDIEKGEMYIRNLDMLYGKVRRGVGIDPKMLIPIIERINEMGQPTIGQLSMTGMFSKGQTVNFLAYLYSKGLISFSNIDSEPVTNTTEVIYIGK